MTEFLPKHLADGQLPASKTTLYTVPASKVCILRSIVLVNTDTSAKTVNLYIDFTGTSRRIIAKDLSLDAGARFVDDTPIILEDGDKIEGDAASADKVDYSLSGVVA